MTCHEIHEIIDDALDGRLGRDERVAFDAHVRQCGSCAAEWELATSLRASLLKIGLDRAPAGMKESISAAVRSARAGEARAGAPVARSFARAAAAVLVVVTLGWIGWELIPGRNSAPPLAQAPERAMVADVASKADDAPRTPAPSVSVVWNADPSPSPLPAGLVASADARTTHALAAAREIAVRGPEASKELNRITTGTATPEHRQRQAEFLVLLDENLSALSEAMGETKALSSLGRDADETLSVFTDDRDAGFDEKMKEMKAGGDARAPAAAARPEPPEVAAEKDQSAQKVVRSERQQVLEASRRGAGAAPPAAEPAFYAVSGPGAIGRVEHVLAERKLRFHPVWLTDRPANERSRKLEDREADYRIIEVEVPESQFDDTIGDLESLVGLRLSPVGRDKGAAPPEGMLEAAAKREDAGKPAGRGGKAKGGGGSETRAPASESMPESAPGAPKSLPIRKLRLVLMGE